MDHPIDFLFDLWVRFSGTADQMDLLPDGPNPRGGRTPSCKIPNDHVSGMGYPIHFHELESSFGYIGENNALPIVSSERTTSPTGLFSFIS